MTLSGLLVALVFLWSFSGSPAASQHRHGRHGNKNWCAFIVQKNVSCAVQAGLEGPAEAAPCPMNQPDCQQQMRFPSRTHFRPTYRISYKTVTELEWRCCPGYQGPDCRELKGSPNRQTLLEHQPQLHPQPRHTGHTRNAQRTERRETGQYYSYHGAEKTRQLEEDVQRLSQTLLDLQASVASMRTDLQNDTRKMLMHSMRGPDSGRTGGTEESAAHLDGHQATRGLTHGERGMEEVLARLNDVTDALKNKDEVIKELRDTVTGHDGQIRMLMDTSQGPAVTPGASLDIDILQSYIDSKFEKLKKELVVDMEDQITKLKSACDDQILALQKTCEEGQDRSHVNLTKLVESKEAELRKEIRELRLDMAMSDGLVQTQRQTTQLQEADDPNDLRQALQQVAEAHRVLNARVDNELEHLSMLQLEDIFGPRIEELEARMNVTEKNAETYCFYVDEKLTRELADETAKIHQLLEEKLDSMEDQFSAMLVEMSNNSFPGMFSHSVDALQTQVNSNKYLIQGLEDKLNVIGQMCSTDCKSSPSSDTQNLEGWASIVKDVKHCRNDLDVLNTDVEHNSVKLVELESMIERLSVENQQNSVSKQDLHNKLKSLTDNVNGLSGAVTGLGDFMSKFSRDVDALNVSCCLAGHAEWDHRQSGVPPQSHGEGKLSPSQVEELRDRLDKLSSQVTAELNWCKDSTADIAKGVSTVNGRVATLEMLCGKLDSEANEIRGIKDKLERDLAQMNSTLKTHSWEIGTLQTNLLNVQSQLAAPKDHTRKQQELPERPATVPDSTQRRLIPHIHIPLIIPSQRTVSVTAHHPQAPPQPGRPTQRRPVLEAGEAGPPGHARRLSTRRERGSEVAEKPVKGFAGAPGYPQVSPVAYKPNPITVSRAAWNPARRLVAAPVSSEKNPFVEPFSFSAGLTQQTFSGDFGIIRFNKVLVNDGGHYDPQTGIFTVPVDGRYLITAVLMAARRERVEAVLSVSNRSIQKLDTAGYSGPSGHLSPQPCTCGGSASFSFILSLRAGDRVALVRTAGVLAISEAREILSTFSAVFLYSPQARR
ncbi:EMILIN-2 [Colossoma macropomum]|uniref:EMILIN-2 n=1 Tax=Colossoma macropomum TaxID=42526 RepID=UPI00186446D1|nr:EMILIN-2 [Colossoma macropomum]